MKRNISFVSGFLSIIGLAIISYGVMTLTEISGAMSRSENNVLRERAYISFAVAIVFLGVATLVWFVYCRDH